MERRETFNCKEEALDCQAHHRGAEMTYQEGHAVLIYGEPTYCMPEDRPAWTVWWDDEAAPSEAQAKEIIERFAEVQQSRSYPCPRCGREVMDPKPTRNALSRRAMVNICNRCGVIEALEDSRGERLPLAEWCISADPARWDVE